MGSHQAGLAGPSAWGYRHMNHVWTNLFSYSYLRFLVLMNSRIQTQQVTVEKKKKTLRARRPDLKKKKQQQPPSIKQ